MFWISNKTVSSGHSVCWTPTWSTVYEKPKSRLGTVSAAQIWSSAKVVFAVCGRNNSLCGSLLFAIEHLQSIGGIITSWVISTLEQHADLLVKCTVVFCRWARDISFLLLFPFSLERPSAGAFVVCFWISDEHHAAFVPPHWLCRVCHLRRVAGAVCTDPQLAQLQPYPVCKSSCSDGRPGGVSELCCFPPSPCAFPAGKTSSLCFLTWCCCLLIVLVKLINYW